MTAIGETGSNQSSTFSTALVTNLEVGKTEPSPSTSYQLECSEVGIILFSIMFMLVAYRLQLCQFTLPAKFHSASFEVERMNGVQTEGLPGLLPFIDLVYNGMCGFSPQRVCLSTTYYTPDVTFQYKQG
eukprot:3403953-Amphidinium_carterae.1